MKPNFQVCFGFHPGEVVGHSPEIVARASPFGAAPVEVIVREVDQREQQLGTGDVLQADLRSPTLVAIVRSAELPPVVVPEGDAVEQRGTDHAIPIRPVHVGVRVFVAEVVERYWQSTAGPPLGGMTSTSPQWNRKPSRSFTRQIVIELDAELVPRIGADEIARRVHEIVPHARQVGPHRRQVQHFARNLAESVRRDHVARKRIADESRPAGIARVWSPGRKSESGCRSTSRHCEKSPAYIAAVGIVTVCGAADVLFR